METKKKNLPNLWFRALIRHCAIKIWDYLSLGVAAGVLLSLFLYISRDLLVTHLAGLPKVNAISFFFGASLASLFQQRLGSILYANDDFTRFGAFISAPQNERRQLALIRQVIWGYLTPLCFWLFVASLPGWRTEAAWIGFFLNKLLIHFYMPKFSSPNPKFKSNGDLLKKIILPLPYPLRWRILQIIGYNRLTRFLLMLAGCLQLSLFILYRSSPGLLWLLAFLGGLLAGFAHAFQASQDMRSSWLEKNAGLSHREFILVQLQLTCLIVLLQFLIGFPSLLTLGKNPELSSNLTWSILLTGPSVTALVPGLILQIDGKKPELTCVALFLVGLFIATAVLAHPIAICLTGLAVAYGLNSQTDRYYRQ